MGKCFEWDLKTIITSVYRNASHTQNPNLFQWKSPENSIYSNAIVITSDANTAGECNWNGVYKQLELDDSHIHLLAENRILLGKK